MKRQALYPWTFWLIWALALPLVLLALGAVTTVLIGADVLLLDHPGWWWLGGVGPLAGLICLYGVWRKRRALERFTSPSLAPLLVRQHSPGKQALRAGLLVAAVLMIVAGLLGPRWGMYLEKQTVHGVDLVVAVDLSRSMLAEDVVPSRLDRAKQRLREQLVDRPVFRRSHRLALLGFAGGTSLRLPLTTDHLAFRAKLEDLRVGMVPRGGTSLAAAIDRAADLFARSPADASRLLLLVTDGEDHEGEGAAAAERIRGDHQVRVFTVGVGDPARPAGAQVPVVEGGSRRPLLHEGQIVFSRMDPASLQAVARAGGGEYAHIDELHHLVDALAAMPGAQLTTEERMRHQPRYQWFVLAALILLIVERMMTERRAVVVDAPQRVWQQELAA